MYSDALDMLQCVKYMKKSRADQKELWNRTGKTECYVFPGTHNFHYEKINK